MEFTKIIAIMLSFFTVIISVPLLIKFAGKIGAYDIPDERKVHTKLIPRIGGIAIFAGYFLSVLLFYPEGQIKLAVLLSSSVIVLVGILDDLIDISPRQKLFGQFLAALILYSLGGKITFLTNPFGGTVQLGLFAFPLTMAWIIGVTNAINLIDGLDGLAAGTSTIAALVLALVAYTQAIANISFLALLLAAASFAFLFFNFNPAKIFMGDTGSMLLGLNLAYISIMSVTKSVAIVSLFVPILILGVPIMDTLCAILRRFQNNRPIFKADKEHLHHCLLNKGMSHKKVVLLIYLINIILGVSAVVLTKLTSSQGAILVIALSVLLFLGAQNIGVLSKFEFYGGSKLDFKTTRKK